MTLSDTLAEVAKRHKTVVDFDLRFTYASIGQPGSMHDTNVLFHALRHDEDKFSHPPAGKYDAVYAGYSNRPGYLAPYKGARYHVPDWRRVPTPALPEKPLHQRNRSRSHFWRSQSPTKRPRTENTDR